jgi:hypothetical protein
MNDDEGLFFVSRFIREVESSSLPEDSSALSDRMVYIGTTETFTYLS